VPHCRSLPVTADIVDTAVASGSFKTLVTALQAAGLVDTLKGKGPQRRRALPAHPIAAHSGASNCGF